MSKALASVLLGAVLCLVTMTSAYWALSNESMSDFGSFVLAGEAYRLGLDPYAVHDELVEATGLYFGFEDRAYSPNLNPPISVYPFSLLARVDAEHARFGLQALSAVVYIGACLALLRAYPAQRRWRVVLWLAAAAPFWYTLWVGQIYVLLFALGLGAWFLLEKGSRPLLAGVLIGLCVAIKPNFAIWPLLLLLAGERKPALTATLTALAISAIPLAIDGSSIYTQWVDAARAYPRATLAFNASLVGTAARLGLEPLGYALGACLVAGGGLLVWRTRPAAREASALAIVLTMLVGPLSWIGYMLFALPSLLARRWGRWELAVAATLTLPFAIGTPAGELRLLAMVVLGGLYAGDVVRQRQAAAVETQDRQVAAIGAVGEAA